MRWREFELKCLCRLTVDCSAEKDELSWTAKHLAAQVTPWREQQYNNSHQGSSISILSPCRTAESVHVSGAGQYYPDRQVNNKRQSIIISATPQHSLRHLTLLYHSLYIKVFKTPGLATCFRNSDWSCRSQDWSLSYQTFLTRKRKMPRTLWDTLGHSELQCTISFSSSTLQVLMNSTWSNLNIL